MEELSCFGLYGRSEACLTCEQADKCVREQVEMESNLIVSRKKKSSLSYIV